MNDICVHIKTFYFLNITSSMSDFSDYTTTTYVYDITVPDVTPYTENTAQSEVINIIANEDGSVEVITSSTVGLVLGEIDPTNIIIYRPLVPEFNFDNCVVTKGLLINFTPSIVRFDIEWLPAKEATHYKVFWLINKGSSVLATDVDRENPLGYTNGPLFSGESDLIPSSGTHTFSYKIPDDSITVINKISIFVFSYTDDKRCDFPDYMLTAILNNKKNGTPIEKVYLEKTTYERYKDIYYTFVDDEPDSDPIIKPLNVNEKSIV